MIRNHLYVIATIQVLVWASCANPLPPDGGPRDEQSPQIDSAATTPNFQTNFKKQRIEITFDEWLKLDKVQDEVIVSPPLTKSKSVTLRGKTVRFDFDEEEVLKDSVTYTINFGESIKDLTEGNIVKNYRFVFSTGPILDSLEFQGQVNDLLTDEPLEAVTVMLYDRLDDSVHYEGAPIYFASTDEEGHFHLQNLKAGTYKSIALLDADRNKIISGDKEKIAFLAEPITLPYEGRPIKFMVYNQKPDFQLDEQKISAYRFMLAFNTNPANVQITSNQTTDFDFLRINDADSIVGWYQGVNWPMELYLADDYLYRDTVVFRSDTSWSSDPFAVQLQSPATLRNHYPKRPITLTLNQPILTLDTSLITLIDTADQPYDFTWRIDTVNSNQIEIDASFKESMIYQLRCLPQSILGLVGSNQDTIDITIQTADVENFATLIMQLDGLDSSQSYVVELLLKTQKVYRQTINDMSTQTFTIEGLTPGTYEAQIVHDANRNGVWDAGHYLKRKQPEVLVTKKIDNLRSNWEMNVTIVWPSNNPIE